jgi:FdhD protein
VPEETPVALSYAGTTHAVMMATPADLRDFAIGFTLTEGIIAKPDEIEAIEIEEAGAGVDIQIRLKDAANTRFEARRRRLAGPVGCGLCGIESIDEAMRSVPAVTLSTLSFSEADVAQAVRLLSKRQPFHAETGAVHAAGFYIPGKGIVAAREDVGRHNALDKLAGALAQAGIDGASGAVVVTLACLGRDGAEDGCHWLSRHHRRFCPYGTRDPHRRSGRHDARRAGARRRVRHFYPPRPHFDRSRQQCRMTNSHMANTGR